MKTLARLSLAAGLAFAACSSSGGALPPDHLGALPIHGTSATGRVDLKARVAWEGDSVLVVSVRVANLDTETIRLERGHCPFSVRAFANPQLEEPAFWDDHFTAEVYCTDELIIDEIPPGDMRLVVDRRASDIMALGLPAAPGYYGVVVVLNGERRVLDAGRLGRP